TGSGCIAIAIKKNAPAVAMTAIDISEAALKIAAKNAADHLTKIDFFQVDFLSTKNWNQLKNYDVIVSNPPYIPKNEMHTMDKNVVGYEPHTALFVDSGEPCIFYEKIAAFGKDHLNRNGMIFMETHEAYAEAVLNLF